MFIAKARTARPTHIRRGHSVNGALSIIKPSFCGFREQYVTSVKIFSAKTARVRRSDFGRGRDLLRGGRGRCWSPAVGGLV